MPHTRKRRDMPPAKRSRSRLDFVPLTIDRWGDFEKLFGENGACGGCWCMWWRLTAKEFQARKGSGNRRAMKRIVRSGRVPGILACVGGEAVGWCSVAPREEFPRLARSRTLRPVDDKKVWSIVCLFIDRQYRNAGLSAELLKGAAEFARRSGAEIVEGYGVEPRKGRTADVFMYHGPASSYRRAGFVEIARRSETRPIMRKVFK